MNSDLIAITYIGKNSGFLAKVGKRTYDFEWQKSLGVGGRQDEVKPEHAMILSRWKDRRGKKIFFLE
jgi:hypothetical protein